MLVTPRLPTYRGVAGGEGVSETPAAGFGGPPLDPGPRQKPRVWVDKICKGWGIVGGVREKDESGGIKIPRYAGLVN